MFLFIIYIVLSSAGLLLFKKGSADLSLLVTSKLFSVSFSWMMILGIFCYLGSFILWLVIVNRSNLSYIYPLSIGCINIAILAGSYYFLGETLSIRGLIGTAIIIIGIIIMK